MALDMDKQPKDPALNAEFHRILEAGAERLAENFNQHGTQTKGGFWCGTEALAELQKTCDDVQGQLNRVLESETAAESDTSMAESA